ncbi:TniQ family protein [Neptunicella sp. SCSIO 80796]|uniref:TniQ family protein n=1 Tax=Neptunicella plasticusilytica TaxID=3117012 RepID=UPI003A4D4E1A
MNGLTVTPLPHLDESLLGYLLRLAKMNGLQTVKELINLCEIRNIPAFPRTSAKSYARLLNGLSDATDIPVERLCNAFNTDHNASLFRSERYIRHIDVKSFQCCPLCMSENRYHRGAWNNVFSTYCNQHATLLIDSCPNCKHPYSWQCSQLRGCKNCGAEYEDYDVVSAPPLPFEQTLGSGSEYDPVLVGKLCSVLCHVLNHNDMMFTPICEFEMELKTRREVIHYAYQLLANPALRHKHCDAIERRGASHQTTPLLGWLAKLADTVVENNLISELPEFRHSLSYVSSHRADIARNGKVPLSRHVGISEAAFTLNIKEHEFRSLVGSQGVFLPITTGKRNDNIVIDRRVLLKAILKFNEFSATQNELVQDLVSIEWVIDHLLPLYRCELAAVFQPLMQQKIAMFRPGPTHNWAQRLIQRSDAIRILDEAFQSQVDDNIHSDDFAAMVCLSPDVADQLVRWSPLTYSRWGYGGSNLHLSLIQHFLARNIVLNRYCVEHQLDLQTVIPLVSCLPVEYPNLRELGCYIFSRNAATEAILDEIKSIQANQLHH